MKDILEKAIQKAIDGGWGSDDPWFISRDCETGADYIKAIDEYCFDCFIGERKHFQIIYEVDFAKALWGEEKTEHKLPDGFTAKKENLPSHFPVYDAFEAAENVTQYAPCWVYHLQQMVIADDPIKYLGENI